MMKQLGIWCAAGLGIQLSINISAANLDEGDFAQRVQLYLLKHRVPASMLELEVTESAIKFEEWVRGRSLAQAAA